MSASAWFASTIRPSTAYELALMTARELAGMDRRDAQVTVVTPEHEPLAMFGDKASAAVREELAAAGVELITGAVADVRPGRVRLLPDGGEIEADRVVAVPRISGPQVPGVPVDADGFVLTGEQQQVEGATTAWAAGDGTSFPVKFGSIATHQARRAVMGVAALVGGEVPEEPPVPVLRSGE
jgi:sulfide:quinone oxidoreductase